MADPTLRPRTASELVDASLRLLRLHFGTYVLVAAAAALPGLVVNVLTLSEIGWGRDPAAAAALDPFGGLPLAGTLVGLVMYAAAETVYVQFTADAYHGRAPSLGDVLRHTATRIPAVLGGLLIRALMIGVGLVLLVVPGVIVFARSAFAAQATVLEGAGPADGVVRSWTLTRGHTLRVLGGIGLAWLLFFVAVFGLQMVAGAGSLIAAGSAGLLVAVVAVSTLGQALLYPLIPIVATLLYFDLRIRREGLDLELMADALGPAAARP